MAKNYQILDFQVSMELSHQDASVGGSGWCGVGGTWEGGAKKWKVLGGKKYGWGTEGSEGGV